VIDKELGGEALAEEERPSTSLFTQPRIREKGEQQEDG